MPGPGPRIGAVIAVLALLLPGACSSAAAGCEVPPSHRFDCGPERLLARAGCEARGCCYAPVPSGAGGGPPWCFFPRGYRSYRAENLTTTARGYSARLRRVAPSFLPGDVGTLRLDVALETESRLRFTVRPGPLPAVPPQSPRPRLSPCPPPLQLRDPARQRYEVPLPTPRVSSRAASTLYGVQVLEDPFGLVVSRWPGGQVL